VAEVDGRRVLSTYHPSAALRFGPNGAPMAALREDLALAASQL
jgi:uracil-DNA glycosylase